MAANHLIHSLKSEAWCETEGDEQDEGGNEEEEEEKEDKKRNRRLENPEQTLWMIWLDVPKNTPDILLEKCSEFRLVFLWKCCNFFPSSECYNMLCKIYIL